jgi:signal transduction histidine kinase
VEVAEGVICARDPTGAELRWPARLPLVIGGFVISVAIMLALQRHEFTSPNWGLFVLVAITLPWALDMFDLHLFGAEWRFSYPVLVTWCAVVLVGVWSLGDWYRVTVDFAPFLVVLLIGEMTATAGPAFGAGVLMVGIVGVVADIGQLGTNLIWIFAFVIGWLGGLAYRSQTQIATELFEAQSRLAAQAKEEERRHLAREIHDLIAHSLAVSMLHLSGARLSLAAGDTDEAAAALADAEAAGRSAMAEIHRSVGLLGQSDSTAPPTPCAADLPELVDGFRRAGLDVRFRLDGDLAAVPLASGLTAYRLVQESLSNAVKHAPGAAVELNIRVDRNELTIRAVNAVVAATPRASSGGNGVRGMAERAALLGGTVVAGNGDGTWKVDARIPWSQVT